LAKFLPVYSAIRAHFVSRRTSVRGQVCVASGEIRERTAAIANPMPCPDATGGKILGSVWYF
jgi:hypothetical protein